MRPVLGFLLLEVALGLLVIATLWGVIIKTVVQITEYQAELKRRIHVIDYTGNYCECFRGNLSVPPCTDGYSVTKKTLPLESAGEWDVMLSAKERNMLCNLIECLYITVSWVGVSSNKQSFTIFTGRRRYEGLMTV